MKLEKCIGGLLGVCLLLLAGCYEPLEITDSEMDMVAEYASGVLIKHGTKAEDTLLNRREQEEMLLALATPTPRPTLAPGGGAPSEGEKDDTAPTEKPKPTTTAAPDNTEITMQALTQLFGREEFFFRYTGYESTVLYQGQGGLFAAAEEGKQLIVIKFDITNESDTGATLLLNKGKAKEFVYTLHIGNKTVKPSITLLEEDFYTSYEAVYRAGETKNCVLVFECGEDASSENMTLSVLREAEENEDSVLLKIK